MGERAARLPPRLPAPDEVARRAVRARTSRVLRPSGALARLDACAGWLAGWQRTDTPEVSSPACLVMVADHGVTVEGVSAYPSDVTKAMLRALEEGAATACVLADSLGVRLQAVDVGVGHPTGNLRIEDALPPERFAGCWEAGRDAVRAIPCDLLVLGEMGIGNTTAAAAVCATLMGGPVEKWVGRGTGLDDAGIARKVRVVEEARARLPRGLSALEVLRRVGGAEMAAIAGAAVEARLRSVPVILDGFVVTASVAPLEVASPGALAHCRAGHVSQEPGHRVLLDKLGMRPLLDLDLRLGEGSGGILAVPLLRAAAAAATRVPTFEEWGLA